MNDGTLLRGATRGDVEGIVALSSGLFLEDAGTRDPHVDTRWPETGGRGYFSEVISSAECLCVVAEVEGSVVGYLVGRISGGTDVRPVAVAELESMYVSPGFRGARIGAALVWWFFRWMDDRGVGLASVTAYRANERAIAFYERQGFAPKKVSLELVRE